MRLSEGTLAWTGKLFSQFNFSTVAPADITGDRVHDLGRNLRANRAQACAESALVRSVGGRDRRRMQAFAGLGAALATPIEKTAKADAKALAQDQP